MSVPSLELGPPTPSESGLTLGTKGGGDTHSPACEGVRGPNSDDWRESLVLCLLCGYDHYVEREDGTISVQGDGTSTTQGAEKIPEETER